MLARNPGATAVAIITLALSIGTNSVIFSGVYSMLLQPLPYPNAGRLAVAFQSSKQGIETGVSYPDFVEWKEQNTAFEQIAAAHKVTVNLTGNARAEGGQVERVTGAFITQDYLALLGGDALMGRTFLPEEFERGAEKTVVLSHAFWQSRFVEDAGVIGKKVMLDDDEFVVLGVMPASFQYPFRAAFWAPLNSGENAETLSDRGANLYEILGLLRKGVPPGVAAGELATLARRSPERDKSREELTVRVTGLRETLPGITKYRTPLLVLQFAVVFVLLIASVNLANLLLARSTERSHEFSVRQALGAGRLRLVRQLLTESMLLGLLGSLLGVVLAWWGIHALRAVIPWRAPGAAEVGINPAVLVFTLVVSLITSFAFGLAPAVLASRQNLNARLKVGGAFDPRRRRLSAALAAAEVALALVLLVASGLMIRTFLNLTRESPGFNSDRAIALSLSPRAPKTSGDQTADYYDQAVARIRAMPGVESVGGVAYLPLIGYNPGTDFTIEGRDAQFRESADRVDFQPITPDYFRAMGIPLLSGRQFSDGELKPFPEVVMINLSLANKFWPGEDPLGKRIRLQGEQKPQSVLTVVGVVGDVKQFGLQTDPRPEIYLPMTRQTMTLIIRTSTEAAVLFPSLRELIQQIDSRAAFSLKTMDQVVADSIERRRVFALLLAAMAGIALVMAAMGVYSVISYLVAQRTREIGIRMALGAQRGDIRRLVVRDGAGLAVVGVGIGLAASLVLARALGSLLYGVSAADPTVLAGTSMLIVIVASMASYLPARRAASVDPMKALRQD